MYRLYRMPPTWREMERIQREMNRLFETTTPSPFRPAPGYPALNVWSSEDGLIVTAEVPGVNVEEIDINVVNDTLTLSGTRQPEQVGEDVRYHRRERGHGKFTRALQLPYPVDANKVEATFRNGVLRINLPRAEETKPQKIEVKAS